MNQISPDAKLFLHILGMTFHSLAILVLQIDRPLYRKTIDSISIFENTDSAIDSTDSSDKDNSIGKQYTLLYRHYCSN